jgi:hypothetical protein
MHRVSLCAFYQFRKISTCAQNAGELSDSNASIKSSGIWMMIKAENLSGCPPFSDVVV